MDDSLVVYQVSVLEGGDTPEEAEWVKEYTGLSYEQARNIAVQYSDRGGSAMIERRAIENGRFVCYPVTLMLHVDREAN